MIAFTYNVVPILRVFRKNDTGSLDAPECLCAFANLFSVEPGGVRRPKRVSRGA